jgi:hypothetical protein
MRFRFRPLIAVVIAALAMPGVASAVVLRIDWAGTVQSAIPGTSLGVGDSVSLNFLLDTAHPTASPFPMTGTAVHDNPFTGLAATIDGVTPAPYSGVPASQLIASGTTSLRLLFDFDGAAAPFNCAAFCTFGRLDLAAFSTGLFGTAGDLRTLNVPLLQTLRIDGVIFAAGGRPSRVVSSGVRITEVTAVPEPSGFALLVLGLVVLLMARGWTNRGSRASETA